MQSASVLRRVILSSVVCLALLYFFTFSHERHDFQGGGEEEGTVLNVVCTFDFIYKFFGNISHSNKNTALYNIIVNVYNCLFKLPALCLTNSQCED